MEDHAIDWGFNRIFLWIGRPYTPVGQHIPKKEVDRPFSGVLSRFSTKILLHSVRSHCVAIELHSSSLRRYGYSGCTVHTMLTRSLQGDRSCPSDASIAAWLERSEESLSK